MKVYSSLINRAGGYTNEAYIDAGIFLRASVAKREKDGLLRAADDLEKGIARAIQTGSFSEVSSPDLAIRLIGNIVEQLKEARPLGRVVTSFNLEDIKNENIALDILLRDQDRIIMPKKNLQLQFLGRFCLQVLMYFLKNLNFNDYLNLAGGLRDGADKNNIFYLLPNGQAAKPSRGWFSD